MTKGQKNLLKCRLQAALTYQPEIELLRVLLLELGGVDLVAPNWFDPDVPLLIRSGFSTSGSVENKPMERGACHRNIAVLWITKQSRLVGIGTGYSLSDDGLWRQHSWGIRRDGILETTVRRDKYFGRTLKGR
jgi:hypothetical protein